MADSYSLPGIDVETVTYPALPLVSRVTNGLASGMSLLKRIEAYSPDILIGYWTYPEGAGAQYVARKLGKPVVIGALGTVLSLSSTPDLWVQAILLMGFTFVMVMVTFNHASAFVAHRASESPFGS